MPRKYTSRGGLARIAPSMADVDDLGSDRDVTGWCLACGTPQDGVEPDARRYECDACGEPTVYGLEELALMGLIKD